MAMVDSDGQAEYDRLLLTSFRLLGRTSADLRMPWESNQWLVRTLGTTAQVAPRAVVLPALLPVVSEVITESQSEDLTRGARTAIKSAMTRVTRKLKDLDWLSALGKARREAVAKWQLWIGLCPMAFAVGRQLSFDSSRKASDEEMQASISDSLASRASRTLVIRQAPCSGTLPTAGLWGTHHFL